MAVERIRQQKTPGQFGVDATSLSPVDLGAASYSRPGVIDRSKAVEYQGFANAAETLGEGANYVLAQGNQFYEGLQLAEVEKAHEKNIQDYIDSKGNPQLAKETAVEMSALETTSNGLWNKLGEGATIEDVDGIEKQYQAKLNTMKNAVKQGVMSTDEFTQRALAITRNAVNRNPGLYNDIIDHTKKVLNLSGMDDLLEADKKAEQSADKIYQKRVDFAMQIAKENNIPILYDRNGNVDLYHLETENAKVQQEKFAAEAFKRNDVYRTHAEKEQAKDFVVKFGYQGANGILNDVHTFVSNLLKDPNNKGEQTTKIREAFSLAKQTMAAKVGPLMHFPEVKEVFDYFNKMADADVSMYEKLTTREDQAKYANNSANIRRDQQFLDVAKVANPQAVDLMTKIITAGGPRLQSDNPAQFGVWMKTLGNIFSEVSNGLETNYTVKNGNGLNAVSDAVKQAAIGSGNGDVNAKTGLDKAVSTIYADSQVKFKSTADKYKFYDDYIKAMADPSAAKGWNNLSEDSRDKAATNFHEYMQLTVAGLKEDLAAIANKGTEINLSKLPDGRLVIQTSNQTDTDLLNQKYTTRINNGVKAFANLIGSETKAASDALFQQYETLKDIAPAKGTSEGDGRPNASNPLNLTIPGKTGKFQKFESTEEGIRAASAQLDRYFTGKTPGTGSGLKTLDEIGGKWNNENEKGSTSKKNYVATLVKQMGVGAHEPLDLNNPTVKADLIHAMSIAEGRPVRPSQIITALGI